MDPTGFVELSFGDITVARRLVSIARGWSHAHRVVVWVRDVEPRWVDALLSEADGGGSTPPTLQLLAPHEEEAALREAGEAAFSVVSSADLAARLGTGQVCVYWPPAAFTLGSVERPPHVLGEPAHPRTGHPVASD